MSTTPPTILALKWAPELVALPLEERLKGVALGELTQLLVAITQTRLELEKEVRDLVYDEAGFDSWS